MREKPVIIHADKPCRLIIEFRMIDAMKIFIESWNMSAGRANQVGAYAAEEKDYLNPDDTYILRRIGKRPSEMRVI